MSVLSPDSLLTFLFTDIEGSTRLWEERPDEMRAALKRHDRILSEAIAEHGGKVFKTIGDAFCAVFADAPRALGAAVRAQEALRPDSSEGLTLRVRMALHTGPAEARDADYFGPSLNRVARLLAIGHGGQVLLSEDTEACVRGALPPEVELEDAGVHRLKDLQQPVHVFQVRHPRLESTFPPLRSLQAFANNLPIQLTSFIGRERELAEVVQQLKNARLLTLTGPGGCGKTRLSLQAAADLLETFPDGVWLTELGATTDPALVAPSVAWNLGLREEPGLPIEQSLIQYLHGKTLLILLDNCEHQVQACAKLANSILRSCPNVRILATSREPLGVGGEVAWRVPSLAVPDPDGIVSADSLMQLEAVRLFADRASSVAPSFAITPENAASVAQVCHRLDGIPLAIELAAARVKVLPVEQIATRLDDRFRLLTGGSRTAMAQHQTLRALIDWSYDLLTEQEKSLLRRLSVFAGGWTLEAAEAVCAGEDIESWEVLDLLSQLVDKSLVMTEESAAGARYRLLQTVRQYGRDRLAEFGETERLAAAHLAWFADMAIRSDSELQGRNLPRCLDTLQAEQDNLRAAMDWAFENDPQAGLKMAASLWRFWHLRSRWTEGRDRLARALEHASDLSDQTARAEALRAAGALALYQTDYEAARSLLQQSVDLCEAVGNRKGLAAALSSLGNVAWRQGDYESARVLYEQGLQVARELSDAMGGLRALINLGNVACQRGRYDSARELYEEALRENQRVGNRSWDSIIQHNLGDVAFSQGHYAEARMHYESSLAICRELKDMGTVARALTKLGQVANQEGDVETARRNYEEALVTYRQLGDRLWEGISLDSLGDVALQQGDADRAESLYRESLAIAESLSDRYRVAGLLTSLGKVAALRGDCERAALIWGAAERIREEIGSPVPPNERESLESHQRTVRDTLGPEQYSRHFETGRALSLDAAVAYARTAEAAGAPARP